MDFFPLKDFLIYNTKIGKIKIVYNISSRNKLKKICKKYKKFGSDFMLFLDNVLKNDIGFNGEMPSADTKLLKKVGCDNNCKSFKIKKIWSSDLINKKSFRIDYIFLIDKKTLFFVDFRVKRKEENHNTRYIKNIVKNIKCGKFQIVENS